MVYQNLEKLCPKIFSSVDTQNSCLLYDISMNLFKMIIYILLLNMEVKIKK